VEAGIGLGGIEPVVREQQEIFEIDRRLVALVSSVVVDHCDLSSGRTRQERFPRNVHRSLIASMLADAWIDRIDLE
jgi:hypothetical protein